MATFVIFQAGEKTCALARTDVARVAPMAALARPPTAPPIVHGFLNLAGDPVPVVEAARVLGVEAGEIDSLYRHILILFGGLALLVDRVMDVRALELANAQTPGDDATLNGCVNCIVNEAGRAVYVLDAERILTRAERERLDQLSAQERARLDQWSAPS